MATAPCPATLYPMAPLVSALSHSLERTLHECRALPVLLTAVFLSTSSQRGSINVADEIKNNASTKSFWFESPMHPLAWSEVDRTWSC